MPVEGEVEGIELLVVAALVVEFVSAAYPRVVKAIETTSGRSACRANSMLEGDSDCRNRTLYTGGFQEGMCRKEEKILQEGKIRRRQGDQQWPPA
jgi:hypothetical protein